MKPALKRLGLQTASVAFASCGVATLAFACTMVPVTIQRFSAATVSLIGTAHADTVRAGPGDVSFVINTGGHFGPSNNRVIYGQRVSVERLAEYAVKKLPRGVKSVVLIPWDYDAGCRAVPWGRSAKWIETGTRGIYTAKLRDAQHWVGGEPTLDVFAPGGIPYTGVFQSRPSGDKPALGIDELFALTKLLPDPDSSHLKREEADKPILEWARLNPDVAEREPARELVWNSVYAVSTERMHNTKPDVSGTWRFSVEVEGDPTRVFYGRTEARPTSPWPLSYGTDEKQKLWEIPELGGFYLLTSIDRELEKLSTNCANVGKHSYIAQRMPSGRGGNVPFIVYGDLDPGLMSEAFTDDVAFKSYKFSRPANVPVLTGMDAALDARARFELGADGVMRVSQGFALQDGRAVMLRGERTSLATVGCDR